MQLQVLLKGRFDYWEGHVWEAESKRRWYDTGFDDEGVMSPVIKHNFHQLQLSIMQAGNLTSFHIVCSWCKRRDCSQWCFWELPRIHILLSFNRFCFLLPAKFRCRSFNICSPPSGLGKPLYPYLKQCFGSLINYLLWSWVRTPTASDEWLLALFAWLTL